MRILTKRTPLAAATNRPTQIQFDALHGKTSREIAEITRKLIDGSFQIEQWYEAMDASIQVGHTGAWVLGRQRAGVLHGELPDDYWAGRMAADVQGQYLRRFADQLGAKDPSVWDAGNDVINEGAVSSRSQLYAGAIRGTANESFVFGLPVATDIYWRLGANEEHCEDCPAIAAANPYQKDTLFAYPGGGDTPCLSNCMCHLETGDGLTGFKRPGL